MSKFSRLAFVAAFAFIASSYASQAHADPAGSDVWAHTWHTSFIRSSDLTWYSTTMSFTVDSAGNHLQGQYEVPGPDGILWTFVGNPAYGTADSGIGDYAVSGDHRTLQGQWWDTLNNHTGRFFFTQYTGTDLSICNWHSETHSCTTSNPCFCGYWYDNNDTSTHYDWAGYVNSTAMCF